MITYKRFQNADFLHSHQIQPVIIVIPVPFSGERISAVWKPFQSTVRRPHSIIKESDKPIIIIIFK